MLDVNTTSNFGDHLAKVVKEGNMREVTRLKVVRDPKGHHQFLVRIYCEEDKTRAGYVRVITHYYARRNMYLYKDTLHQCEWESWNYWGQLYVYENINNFF